MVSPRTLNTLFSILTPCLLIVLVSAAGAADRRIPAFPGAEGFGAFATGGRGGKVCLVTTLEDYGPSEKPIEGSLRAAIDAKGPRIVVFRVSGLIDLKSQLRIKNPDITIAGQSAPGQGVCLKNRPLRMAANNVMIRYLRSRPGDVVEDAQSAFLFYGGDGVMFDHCSATWATDENFTGEGNNVTVQWCLIAEGLNRSFHPKGEHSHGALVRSEDGGVSFHHNLFADNASRNPRPGGRANKPGIVFDFRNNALYNWGYHSGYNDDEPVRMNYVSNYLKPGPSTKDSMRKTAFSVGGPLTRIFAEGNRIEGFPEGDKDNWRMMRLPDGATNWDPPARMDEPFPAPPIATTTAREAFDMVLADVGATRPARDAADQRIIDGAIHNTGRIIDAPQDVGGWPKYAPADAPPDADRDGMPDAWEEQYGFDSTRDDSSADADGDGYTNIEEFLNETDPTKPDRAQVGFDPSEIQTQIQKLNVERMKEVEAYYKQQEQAEVIPEHPDVQAAVEPAPGPQVRRLVLRTGEETTMALVLIPAGKFIMGSPESEEKRHDDEKQHEVTISRAFYLGATPVTVAQYDAVVGSSKASKKSGDRPVACSWFETERVCEILTRVTGQVVRLPTEAEWEYACRAATTTPFYTGETIGADQANYDASAVYGPGKPGEFRNKVTPVEAFPPNPWGLYDMPGNAFEWCSDWSGKYPDGPATDPQGPQKGSRRVIRGGAYGSDPQFLRSAARYSYSPDVEFGFRVAMQVDAKG